MKKLLMLVVLLFPLMGRAAVEPISVDVAGFDFVLPFQKVTATQLYSFDEGRGFPGVETTLIQTGRCQLTFGAAPLIGTSVNVPFVSVQGRLNPNVFDTRNNEVMFGVWAGRPSERFGDKQRRVIWGIKASIPLW